MYYLDWAGIEAFEIWTKSNRFCGVVAQHPTKGHHTLYWNSTATRGSKRKFKTRQEAIEFMHQRRIKKGWSTQ